MMLDEDAPAADTPDGTSGNVKVLHGADGPDSPEPFTALIL
jgi:hypothetical protein